MVRIPILCALITFSTSAVFASNIDYYDRFFINIGLERGVSYKTGEASVSDVISRLGIGYGFDDDKILNLNIYSDLNFSDPIINPEFGLILNEFSRLKFLMSLGIDAPLTGDFYLGLRNFDGVIFDILDNLALMTGIDTRLNIYKEVYFGFFANISLIIKI